ncbi:MAG: class II aldolase/adducin family protein [Desulfosarcina sp.]|nr:class II aldolase/adducin family protein [Desulfosarcina sp.]MBC2767693.1 class II aldolase/adducin family protein [Desulfosarcina sp.]
MDPYFQYRKDIIDCCQWLCRHGYFGSLLSAGGNVSVRIPDEPVVVITPSGKPYMELVPENICVVDFNLNRIDSDLAPSIETAMHVGIYQNRADVGAVVHTHQVLYHAEPRSAESGPDPGRGVEKRRTAGEDRPGLLPCPDHWKAGDDAARRDHSTGS